MRVEPGVDARGVGIEDGPGLRCEERQIAFRGLPPSERPDEAIVVDRPRAEQLGETTGRDVPPDLHLPHALLRVDVALGHEQVVRVGGLDLGDAVEVAPDGRRRAEARDTERA